MNGLYSIGKRANIEVFDRHCNFRLLVVFLSLVEYSDNVVVKLVIILPPE